jgi:ABC-type polysaccharide/polyol phosphate export permease
MFARWRFILRQAWIMARAEMTSLLSNRRTLFNFYLQFLIVSAITLIPIYLFNRQSGGVFAAAYLAGLLNSICAQQFSGRVIGRVESGEYEIYLLSPIPMMSVYLTNVLSLALILPVIVLIYALAGLTVPDAQLNLPLFLLAAVLTFVLNIGVSIFLAGVHIAYRSLYQISNIASIVTMLYCAIGVIPLYNSQIGVIVQFVPWTHSTFLVMQSVKKVVPWQQIWLSMGVILAIALITTPLALRFYALAERKRKRDGFVSEVQLV